MKMKRKGIILASAILGSVAVVSTGFAAWVITNPNVQEEATGNIKVETVEQEGFEVSVNWVEEDGTPDATKAYSFTGKEGTRTYNWLSFSGDPEDLSERFYLSVKKVDNEGVKTDHTGGTFTVALDIGKTVTTGETTEWQSSLALFTADTQKYIVLPELQASYNVADYSESTNSLEVAFEWGEAFDNKNPLDYFNQAYSADLADEADEKLNGLYNLTNGLEFKLTITYSAF